jgi:hypothetical protein
MNFQIFRTNMAAVTLNFQSFGTTLTFDLDLDIDLAKRCLSYVSIIILSIINRD